MCHHIAKAFYPPARASYPQAPVYMNLQPPRRTARTSLHGRWALTPPSHPYPCGRLFSSALLHLRRWLSVRKWSALCCPDFPPLPCDNGDRPSDCLFLRVTKVDKCPDGIVLPFARLSVLSFFGCKGNVKRCNMQTWLLGPFILYYFVLTLINNVCL